MSVLEKLEKIEKELLLYHDPLELALAVNYTEKGDTFVNSYLSWQEMIKELGTYEFKLFKTYSSFEGDNIFCNIGRYRSIDDTFLTLKYYFPDVTLIDVYKWVMKEDTNSGGLIQYFYCPTISKRVLVRRGGLPGYVAERTDKVEHGITDDELKELL